MSKEKSSDVVYAVDDLIERKLKMSRGEVAYYQSEEGEKTALREALEKFSGPSIELEQHEATTLVRAFTKLVEGIVMDATRGRGASPIDTLQEEAVDALMGVFGKKEK